MPEPKVQETVEDRFRSTLRDVVEVIKKLAPECGSVDDLVGMCELAMKNDGQLRLLLNMVAPLELRMKRSA
jgi:hypothetical protein